MGFPDEPLRLRAELLLGGAWTDITQRVYSRDPIKTTAGQGAEGTRVDPSACTLTLNNKDGAFSPRNPLSPYFGQLGRNTPLRITVAGPESYLRLDGTPVAVASTPHVPALAITGDLDVRAEVTPDDWNAGRTQNVIGRWNSANAARSWLLQLEGGLLRLRFSPDGTSTFFIADRLPALPARAALRATLDVNNGAGGWSASLFWAPSLDGPWQQFSTGSSAGTTSLYAAPGVPLLIAPTSAVITPNWLPMAGRVHRAEVRSGIGGTVVAAPDFRVLAPDTSAFTDGAGRAWTVTAPAAVTDREYLFSGEVSAWPPRWVPGDHDVWVPIEAAGILRRLGQGRKALSSSLARRIPSYSPLAYWPLEEAGSTTGRAYSPVPGCPPMTLTGVNWASNDSLPSSSPLPTLNSSNGASLPMMSGAVPSPPAGATGWQVRWLYKLDQANTTLYTFMRIRTTGTITDWYIQSRDIQTRVLGRDADGNTVIEHFIASGSGLFGKWQSVNVRTAQVGGTVQWAITWADINGDFQTYDNSYTGSIGRVRGVASPPDGYAAALDGMAIGHITVFGTTVSAAYNGAITGYAGESAINRLFRLAEEETQLPLKTVDGDATLLSEAMGPQRPQALLELLEECAEADGGILAEQKEALGLVYRDRSSLYNQLPGLVLDYAAGDLAPPLEPVDDDLNTRNDVTVTRQGGGSARVVVEDGPLSVQAPEAGGVGIYDEAITLNLATDDQAEPIAAWMAHLGTWDEARYPSIRLLLHERPALIPAVLGLRIGDLVRILRPPLWAGATEALDLHVQQIQHTPRPRAWEVVLVCTPAGPWRVGVLEDPIVSRADTARSTLAAAVTASALSIQVSTPSGPWTTASADMPLNIRVGGEVMTVTAISGATTTQTMTVARSVNGITKSHPAGTGVRLAVPTITAL
ncbi:hypothetical protein ACWEJP_20950 [Streptomyces sp. NPDC004749]